MIIQVSNLSKRYIIGHLRQRGDGLRHRIEDAFRAPWRWLKREQTVKRVSREEFWALKDLDFEIEAGEAVGIIGRNGAGKSTLLKILSRITEPTTGRIRMGGRVASLLEVGTGFHAELTGRENIFLNGAILGMTRVEIRRKFDEIVAFSEVEKFLDTPVKRYSSGMYVRLAFAVAAHLEPEILIVDEVLAVGDSAFQSKCLGKMQEVSSKQGRTVLFVSHQLSAVQRLCSKGLLLRQGKVICFGPVAKTIERYYAEGRVASSQGERPSGDVTITGWRCGEGAPSEHASVSRQNCEFLFEVQATKALKDLQLGFCLRSLSGELVLSGNSRDSADEYLELRRGTNRIRVQTRLPLRPGLYELDVSIHDLHFKILDHRTGEPFLTILPAGRTILPESWQGLVNEALEVRNESI